MNMPRVRFSLLCLALVSLILSGCVGGKTVQVTTYTVRGTVWEADTEVPLYGAVVELGGIQAITNAAGQYELQKVPKGAGTLEVRLNGYEDHSQEVLVAQGTTISVGLETRAASLDLEALRYEYKDNTEQQWIAVESGSTVSATILGVAAPYLLEDLEDAEIILNGEIYTVYVFYAWDSRLYIFYDAPIFPGLNTIQLRVWDSAGHARTTPVFYITSDLPTPDVRVLLDCDVMDARMDLHLFKRAQGEAYAFDPETEDRHVFYGNPNPDDFGSGGENPLLDSDAYGGQGLESLFIEKLTPGDYHIWAHDSGFGEHPPATVTAQIIIGGIKMIPPISRQLPVQGEIYLVTLRVEPDGTSKLVDLEL